MRKSPRHVVARIFLSFVIGAGSFMGAATLTTPSALAASTVAAPTCVNAETPPATVLCPTIVGFTVGSAWIRSAKTTFTFPVTLVVDDPADIVIDADTTMGRGIDPLQVTSPSLVVAYGDALAPRSVVGSRKTFTMIVESPYLPIWPSPASAAYGSFQMNAAVYGADPFQPLTQAWRTGNIKARSVMTNTPSVVTVRTAQWFTERGKLTRFDGTPQSGQKVNVYYVPAGQTRASYAGSATTSSTGAWSLPVRSWLTGAWFASYPGSSFSTSVYKSAWIRVS